MQTALFGGGGELLEDCAEALDGVAVGGEVAVAEVLLGLLEDILRLRGQLSRRALHDDRRAIIALGRGRRGRLAGGLRLCAANGFRHVPFNDLDAVRAAVGPRTAAILVEPLQGEGGVNVAADGYLRALRDICDEHNLLLMLDEVQTGIGRTGKMFAWQHENVQPDVMALAKGLGSGVPIGAIVANRRGDILEPGDHGTTFGGQPFTCAVANATVRHILREDIPAQAAAKGERLMNDLRALQDRHPVISEVRGQGLLVAVEFSADIGPALVAAIRERGMLCNVVKPNTLRLVPPLTVSDDELTEAVAIINAALDSVSA